MTYSVNDTKDFNSSIVIGIKVKKNGERVITCELSYWDKISQEIYKKVYPASKFDKVCKTYNAINAFMIPKNEIKDTVENIK